MKMVCVFYSGWRSPVGCGQHRGSSEQQVPCAHPQGHTGPREQVDRGRQAGHRLCPGAQCEWGVVQLNWYEELSLLPWMVGGSHQELRH